MDRPRPHTLPSSPDLPPVTGRRCEVHGLAVGLDGRCVRCRRIDERTAEAARSRWPGWPVILSALATLVVLGYLFFGPPLSEKKKIAPLPTKTVVVIKPDSRLLWEQLGSGDEPAEPSPRGTGAGQPGGSTARPSPPARPAAPVTAASSPSQHPRAYLDLVREAAGKVPVQVYYTTWCPACTRARKWLDDNQIPYSGYDVERTEGAKRELRRLNPQSSIPTFRVGKQMLAGFSSSMLSRAILAEANR